MKASALGNLANRGNAPLEQAGSSQSSGRQPYCSPRLVELGDVRMLTLGGTPGFGDSQVDPREN